MTDVEQRVLKIQYDMEEIDVSERDLMVAAAGVVAQGRAIPGSVEPYHDEADWEDAAEGLDRVCENRGISETQARAEATERSQGLFEDPIVWQAVDAVAKALLEEETMQGREVVAVIRSTYGHHHAD